MFCHEFVLQVQSTPSLPGIVRTASEQLISTPSIPLMESDTYATASGLSVRLNAATESQLGALTFVTS